LVASNRSGRDATAAAAPLKDVSVTGADGKRVPAQIVSSTSSATRVAFLAKLPSVGFSTYGVRLSWSAPATESSLRVEERQLENERYVVKLNNDGDVASIFDKKAKHELLSAPARLELHYENPRNWPSWNQDWADRQLPVREYVGGPAKFRIVER